MFSEKTVNKALEVLSTMDKTATSRFVMVAKNGTVHKGNSACHGALAGFDPYLGRLGVITATLQSYGSIKLVKDNKAARTAYLDYLINRSPWADAYLDKDANHCIDVDAVCVRGDVPSNQMAAACVATRSMWEREGSLCYAFYGLVKGGVQEDLAMLLANLISYKTDHSKGKVQIKWCRQREDHHPVCPLEMKWGCVSNFLKHNMAYPNKTWIESAMYRGINKLFLSYDPAKHPAPDGGLECFSRWVVDHYKTDKKPGAEYNNPFPKPKPVVTTTPGFYEDIDVAISGMIEFVNEKLIPKLKEEGVL